MAPAPQPAIFREQKNKFTTKDAHQLKHSVLVRGKVVICKSAFRRNIARQHHLRAGKECVEYIKNNFRLAFLPFPSTKRDLVRRTEKELIATIKPRDNISHKS